jgi:hypothetical protein
VLKPPPPKENKGKGEEIPNGTGNPKTQAANRAWGTLRVS